MNDSIETFLNTVVKPTCEATEQALSEYTGEGNLQFPALVEMIALKYNWSEKDVRDRDPIIRSYVRKHKDWHVTRGAHGGIMRAAAKQAKDAAKNVKDVAKQQMRDAIEAKTAAQNAQTNNTDSE